ncbi:MAG: hypothetical protein E6I88_10020 [Chloroflexi bacterium]|nr:MAG: hypothetical protein E6I88_10020 [Chloroflexota bacterium]TME47297.1 MAG: hypothetical protein E6I56_04565 [Chloroflexota bacterium]
MTGESEFESRLDRLIRRVEAWNYAESDAGAGLPVEIAKELGLLAADAPTASLRRTVRAAQDALDDGLPAETVAAELYRIRQELSSS